MIILDHAAYPIKNSQQTEAHFFSNLKFKVSTNLNYSMLKRLIMMLKLRKWQTIFRGMTI